MSIVDGPDGAGPPPAWRRAGGLMILLGVVPLLLGCPCPPIFSSPEKVDSKPVFAEAVRSPDTFDAELRALSYHDRTAECLRVQAEDALEMEDRQLSECAQILTGTPAWNECHDVAEAWHNRGVILTDVANALEGERRFDQSSGGQYLLLARDFLGPAAYEMLVDTLIELAPDMTCELPCE